MDSEEDISEDLICPICLHLPADEIYQCNNGHSICAECCKNTEECPHCRVSYEDGKIRNRAMESFIGNMKCSCPYKSLGCTETMKRSDLSSHKQTCIHNGKSTQICKLVGFVNCDVWTSALKVDTAITHFMETHGFISHGNFKGVLNLENFLSSTLSMNGATLKDSLWTPVLVEYKYKTTNKDDDTDSDSDAWSTDSESSLEINVTQKFIVLSRFHREDKSMSWVCIFLGDLGKEVTQFEVHFEITTTSAKVPDLKWKIPSIGLLYGDLMAHQVCPFRVPISLLHKYYVQSQVDDVLIVKFEIVRVSAPNLGIDETDDDDEEAIWTFNIPLLDDPQTLEKSCNECLGTGSEVLFQCVTCSQPIYICGKCIETCSHPASHELKVVSGLESGGNQNMENNFGTLVTNQQLEHNQTNSSKDGDYHSAIGSSLEELSQETDSE